jgi:hypothetical protein
MTRAELLAAADELMSRVDDLEAQYGNGIRPAWVGDEIGMLCGRADRLKQHAATAED